MKLRDKISWRLRKYTKAIVAPIEDFFADRALQPRLEKLRKSAFYEALPSMRVLVVGVQSARRPGSLDRIYDQMRSSRHTMTFESKGVDNMGKLDNTVVLLNRHNLDDFDWVIMVDDDVELPDQFTDTLLALAEYADLKICGPAQRAHSYWSYPITKRQKNSLVRETNFAEVGPIVAFRREVFHLVFPFPSLKYGWGIDIVWPVLLGREGWKTGIADGAALRHISPIGSTYNFEEAAKEGEAYMNRFGIQTGVNVLRTIATIREIN